MHVVLISAPANFHCRKWATALAQAGARVTVVGLEPGPPLPGVDIRVLAAPYRRGGVPTVLSFWASRHTLRHTLEALRPDVLHPLHLTPYGVWARWSGYRACPVIAAALGADVFEYPPPGTPPPGRSWANPSHKRGLAAWRAGLSRRYFRRQVQAVVNAAHALTADNPPLAQALRDWFACPADKLHVLRWGTDVAALDAARALPPAQQDALLAPLGLAPGKRVVLSARGLTAVYQADIIANGFGLLLDDAQVPATHQLVMLGAGYPPAPPILTQAEALARRHPDALAVYTGQLSPQQMAALWARTDVFVSAPVYDGYSASVAEGRYAGAIPVVNDIPGNRDVLQPDTEALYVQPFDAPTLAQTLRHALHQLPHLHARLAPPNRAWVLQHSNLQASAQQFLALAQRHRLVR